jgi:hypothetical protein
MKLLILGALATLAAFAFATAGQAADLLSLECQDVLTSSPNAPLTMRIWIDQDHSLAVMALNLTGGPGSTQFTYWGPDAVSISPRQFVIQNTHVTIDRFSGGGSESSNTLKSCARRDLPYPPDAPSLVQKF